MKDEFVLFVKGFLVGIGKIIPGVSGAMLAITLGIYEKALESIHTVKSIIQNFPFLLWVGLGVLLSIVLGSNVITYFIREHYFPTMLLFIGMIMGGIPSLYHKTKEQKWGKKDIVIFLCAFIVVFLFPLLHGTNSQVTLEPTGWGLFFLFFIGLLEATTMIVPGISGTALMMIIGCYEPLLEIWGNLFNIELLSYHTLVLIPFILGVSLGIFLLAKTMNYLFHHHFQKTYIGILGFATSSIVFLVLKTIHRWSSFRELIVGFLLFIIGYQLAFRLEKIENRTK